MEIAVPNLTLAIDGDVLRKVRKLAVERDTSVTAMVRDILEQLAKREEVMTEEVIHQLRESFDATDVRVGPKTWSREDIHAR